MNTKNHLIRILFFLLVWIVATGCKKNSDDEIPVSYSVSITTDGNGTATANPVKAEKGKSITLTATPNNGFIFKQWVVLSGGISIANTTANPTAFIMPADNVSIKAEFNSSSSPSYSVTVTTDGNGTAAANPTETTEGVTVTLTATPDNGFTFKQWIVISGEIALADATAHSTTFAMPASPVSVKAEFSKTGEEPGPDEPDSEFWDNQQHAQNRLKGKVKTIRETDDRYPDEYTLIEYDSKGKLLKEFDHTEGWFRGYTYSYDSKGRLTKVVGSNTDNGDYDITEIGYDGRHNKFIPTDFAPKNVRLQRGVTSFTNVYKGELQVKVNLLSVNGNRLIFKAEVIDLISDEFGSNELTITADFKGDFPTTIKIVSTNDETTEIEIEYFPNGMPAKINYIAIYDLTQETAFKAGASFMLLESEKIVRNGKTTVETHEYDEKENCILTRENGENGYRYKYQYDNTGNWTEMTQENFSSGQWRHRFTKNREYTYW